MNREIKFRALDDGKMVYEKDISHLSNEDNDIFRLAKFFCNVRNDSIIMQYTGLKDKNGTEIYEGDIVDIHETVNGQSKFVILSCLGCYDVRYAFDIKVKYEYDVFDLLDVLKNETEIEVIGNIYEHKHLLDKK